jgi:serine/threonine-protein kinase RsbW
MFNMVMRKRLKIESKQASLRLVENAIDDATLELGISQDSYGKILVSALEAVNNAMLHGNKMDPEKIVRFEIDFRDEELKITVGDEGIGFRPQDVPDPTLPQNIESCNGRGVYLMSHLADKIKYSKKGNVVMMTFKNIQS